MDGINLLISVARQGRGKQGHKVVWSKYINSKPRNGHKLYRLKTTLTGLSPDIIFFCLKRKEVSNPLDV